MSKKRNNVSQEAVDAIDEGRDLPPPDLEALSQPPATADDPFRGRRGKGDPTRRAQYWIVGLDPSNGTVRVLWRGKTRRGASKWLDNVRMLLAGTWAEVRVIRAKPVQPSQWSDQ